MANSYRIIMVYPGPIPLRITRQDVTTHHLDMLHIPRIWCREDGSHEDSHPSQVLPEKIEEPIHNKTIRIRTPVPFSFSYDM